MGTKRSKSKRSSSRIPLRSVFIHVTENSKRRGRRRRVRERISSRSQKWGEPGEQKHPVRSPSQSTQKEKLFIRVFDLPCERTQHGKGLRRTTTSITIPYHTIPFHRRSPSVEPPPPLSMIRCDRFPPITSLTRSFFLSQETSGEIYQQQVIRSEHSSAKSPDQEHRRPRSA